MSKIYSVGQVNQYIRNMFQSDFLLNKINVQGEVSNCKYHTSGHIYFTLKDKDGTLSAIMFAGNRGGLKFRLEDGMLVNAQGNITIYERDGKYQLYVRQIEQAGLGARYEEYLQLKQTLEDMGMFDPMFKKSIPRVVKTLGVVTAPTGAAIQDIINVSTRRNPYIQIVLYPALVQGEGAADSICRGIRTLDAYGTDVIIAGRGGGSIEDLWAFNEEKVARAIFDCNTPVISAVGHETDYTIADFVADLRAPTPSAAAELAVCDMAGIINNLEDFRLRLSKSILFKLEDYSQRLNNYRRNLQHLSPEYMLNERMNRLEDLRAGLSRAMKDKLGVLTGQLAVYCSKLETLSPVARLSSGYSFVSDENGSGITSVSQACENDILTIHVLDGRINARVTGTEQIQREIIS
ncbi:MAG: exodeoxyribonuclease VII large subunit [Butyrivibrio sp.]